MCKHNLFAFPYSFIWDSTNIWTTIQSLCDTRRSCILPIFVIICEEIIILHIFTLISGDPVSLSNFIKITKTVRVKDVTYYKSKGLPIFIPKILWLRHGPFSVFIYFSVQSDSQQDFQFQLLLSAAYSLTSSCPLECFFPVSTWSWKHFISLAYQCYMGFQTVFHGI